MKPEITLHLKVEDYGGERGKPEDSPLARAMSRETGQPFRHVGRILFTLSGTPEVAQVYNLGHAGTEAWRCWCNGCADPIGDFVATLMPQAEGYDLVEDVRAMSHLPKPIMRPLPPLPEQPLGSSHV